MRYLNLDAMSEEDGLKALKNFLDELFSKQGKEMSDNRFGVCPICKKTDGYVNIQRVHFFVCDAHKVYWPVGTNLFSDWREEDQATWERNGLLLAGYQRVAPWFETEEPK